MLNVTLKIDARLPRCDVPRGVVLRPANQLIGHMSHGPNLLLVFGGSSFDKVEALVRLAAAATASVARRVWAPVHSHMRVMCVCIP